jgi:acetyl-CoA synthetase
MKLPDRPNSGQTTFETLVSEFRWEIPDRFNIGRAVADAWAMVDPGRICLQHFQADGHHLSMTYGELKEQSDRLANGLISLGIARGDRVALLLPQGFDVVIAHVAIYKIGAIALPLALLFGNEAISYRLADSGAAAIITNAFGLSKLSGSDGEYPGLRHVILTEGPAAGTVGFQALIQAHPPAFACVETTPDDPALMIYTSGTTGPPKGALHGHRVLAGHIPGLQLAHEFFPQEGDRFWTPSDWAWAGGLLNCLLPSLMLGVPVVSSPSQKFDAALAWRIIAEMGVRNAFIPPTALRLMASVEDPMVAYPNHLRTIGSAGETLGRQTYEWARAALGITVNEFYGQTECNFVLGSSAGLGVSRAGAIGKALPGHVVAIIDDKGREVPAGTIGQIAVRRPDPVMFLGYWNNPEATRAKFIGDFMLTGDQGVADAEGYFTFFGRDDDVITSSGYRIGPAEIEDCLVGHPAVRLAAVIGKPDALRTEIVKAFVVLKDGFAPSPELSAGISDWVKTRLSMHEYPREVEFVDALPMTTTGKIMRRILRNRETSAQATMSGQIRFSGPPAP